MGKDGFSDIVDQCESVDSSEEINTQAQDESTNSSSDDSDDSVSEVVSAPSPPRSNYPVPAFVLFCKEMFRSVQKENGNLSEDQIFLQLGTMWENMDAEGKAKYREMYRQNWMDRQWQTVLRRRAEWKEEECGGQEEEEEDFLGD